MEQFITDLRILAQPCDFKENTGDEMIRVRIMCGVESDLVRQKLIEKGAALTLTDAITTTRSYETVQSQLAAMTITPPTAIKQEIRCRTPLLRVLSVADVLSVQAKEHQRSLVAVKRAICVVNPSRTSIG